jgi:hypothetical protein
VLLSARSEGARAVFIGIARSADVDLALGGRLGWLTPLAWSLSLLGGALILGSALLVVYGARPPGPRVPRQAAPGQPPEVVRADTPVTLVAAQAPQLEPWAVQALGS